MELKQKFDGIGRKNYIVLGVLALVVAGLFIYNYSNLEEPDDNRTVNRLEYDGVKAEVVKEESPREVLRISDISAGDREVEKGTVVVFWNKEPQSSIVLVTRDQDKYFEKTVPGYSNSSWKFYETGNYSYFVNNVNNTGNITVR